MITVLNMCQVITRTHPGQVCLYKILYHKSQYLDFLKIDICYGPFFK